MRDTKIQEGCFLVSVVESSCDDIVELCATKSSRLHLHMHIFSLCERVVCSKGVVVGT